MPNYDNLLHANMPEALETAVESLNFVYDSSVQLLHADVSLFEDLKQSVFAYFDRDDIFYLNKAGRNLLINKTSIQDPTDNAKAPPICWLQEDLSKALEDQSIIEMGLPKKDAYELVTFSWGKTWFQGSKFPIRSKVGTPLAMLFAGKEMPGSKQIGRVLSRLNQTHNEFGEN